MLVSGDNQKVMLHTAVQSLADKQAKNDVISKLMNDFPGHQQADYEQVTTYAQSLMDKACKLVFRWINDGKTGDVFELPDRDRVFIDQLAAEFEGFSDEDYNAAVAYGFECMMF